jgi:nucleoid-associated protein YgaU
MHRDTKLGLALAILVMGFAAALCFPRGSGEQPVGLTLQSAADLDEAIRLMPVKSYTDADRPPPRGTELTSADAVAGNDAPPLAGVPDPIQIPRESEPTPIDPGQFPAEVVAEPDAEPVIPTRTYRVQYGDSLSLIADRELGSHKYWSTLFNANRHLLRTENDLKPGMELIIPIESGDEVTPATPQTTPGTAVTPVAPRSDAPPTRATGRFSPPRTRVGSSGTSTNPQ